MSVTLKFYVNGALTNGFQLFTGEVSGSGGLGTIVRNPGSATDAYGQVQLPNAHPLAQAAWPGILGAPVASSQQVIFASFDGGFAAPYIDEWRFFVGKITVKAQWNDGVSPTPLQQRWIGGAGYVYSNSGDLTYPRWFDTGAVARLYGLTDPTGTLTFYALYGMSYHTTNDGLWHHLDPTSGGLVQASDGQNFGFTMREHQLQTGSDSNILRLVPYGGDIGLEEGYYLRQYAVDGTREQSTSADGGNLWSINYATAWDNAGNLTLPAFPLKIWNAPSNAGNTPTGYTDPSPPVGYRQYLDLTVQDGTGLAVSGATVTFGGGAYTGLTDVNGRVILRAKPNGSTLIHYPGGGGQTGLNPFTGISVIDGSTYAAGPAITQVKPPTLITGNEISLAYATKSGNDLQSVTTTLTTSDLFGGEPATISFSDLTVIKGGSTYVASGTLHVTIYEDQVTVLLVNQAPGGGGGGDKSIDADGLDFCQDAFAEPFLIESRQPQVYEWTGIQMEKTWGTSLALNTTVKSPSQVILADGRRLLLFIDPADTKCKQFFTDTDWATESVTLPSPTVVDGGNNQEVIVRLDPDGNTVHAWVTQVGGSINHSTSADGGETWAAQGITGMPGCRAERGDVRHDGVSAWLRAHPYPPSDGIDLRQSFDGENWTTAGTITATGKYPWLVVLPQTGEILCLYCDGGNIVSRNGTSDATGAWTWAAAVTVGAAPSVTGPAAFANGQKVVCAWRTDKQTLAFAVSLDHGATWQTGSDG